MIHNNIIILNKIIFCFISLYFYIYNINVIPMIVLPVDFFYIVIIE